MYDSEEDAKFLGVYIIYSQMSKRQRAGSKPKTIEILS